MAFQKDLFTQRGGVVMALGICKSVTGESLLRKLKQIGAGRGKSRPKLMSLTTPPDP